MRIQKLKPFENQVVVLDLIMGREITTRIQEVNERDGYVVCAKPRVFVPVPNPHNPEQMNIMCLQYGHPMYVADELLEIDAAHIFTLFKPTAEHIDAYTKKVSGLVAAPAGALNQLKGLDLSKIGR